MITEITQPQISLLMPPNDPGQVCKLFIGPGNQPTELKCRSLAGDRNQSGHLSAWASGPVLFTIPDTGDTMGESGHGSGTEPQWVVPLLVMLFMENNK